MSVQNTCDIQKSSLLFVAAVAVVFAVSGCQTDLQVERYEYLCKSSTECSRGYECAHLQDRNVEICVPPEKVEQCTTPGDEDEDGAADCDDRECVGTAACSVDAGGGDVGDVGSDVSDAGDAGDTSDTGDAADAISTQDRDNDGVLDAEDNCPEYYNPDQRTTSNGIAVACAEALLADDADSIFFEDSPLGGTSGIGGVVILGDLDDDGLDDLAVGTPAAVDGKGRVSILLSTSRATSETTPIKLSSADVRLRGPTGTDRYRYGSGIAAIGDLDGDGISELAVGHPNSDNGTGELFGAVGIYYSREIKTNLDGTPQIGLVLLGEAGGDQAGMTLAALGDVNGDGVPDFAVGAPGALRGSGESEGMVYIVSGSAISDPSTTTMDFLGDAPVKILGEPGSLLGHAISAGRFDSDELADVVLGAPKARDTGAVYLIRNLTWDDASSISIDLSQSGNHHRTFTSEDSSGFLGGSVALDGDLDGDGRDDLVVSSQWATVEPVGDLAGKAHVIYGTDALPEALELTAEGLAGLTLEGVEAGQLVGSTVRYVGDVNSDGRSDLIVSGKDSGTASQGAAYLILGTSGERTLPVTDAGVVIEGVNDHDNLGLAAAAAGSYAGGAFPGFVVYSPSGEVGEGLNQDYVDVPTWYHFTGPFYR